MRNTKRRVAALFVIAFSAAGATATTVGVNAVSKQTRTVPLLYPLSVRDTSGTRESGCEVAFNDRRQRTLVYMIGHDFMVRTRSGRAICQISDEQFGAISDQGSQVCAGMRITVRNTGRTVSHPETDSATRTRATPITRPRACGTTASSIRRRLGTS